MNGTDAPTGASATSAPRTSRPELLTVYLNDHLTGSGGGVRLIRRMAGIHRDTPFGPKLAALAREIEEDQHSLRRIMRDLGVPVSNLREAVGRVAELAGRLKLNGRILSRSPLSDVLELEAMRLGVQGKAACWTSLRTVADGDDRLDAAELDRLLARAEDQVQSLEALRVSRAREVFTADLRRTSLHRTSQRQSYPTPDRRPS
ncbi:hypothetical protein [Streptomyces venezuelae]|uniref:hypothetical protein n=1 Tax=Streptomyces venezuelae TaxID=54571 RepID=UPI001CC24281|nr:hypothetical protein [Streptomyces venezuelae]